MDATQLKLFRRIASPAYGQYTEYNVVYSPESKFDPIGSTFIKSIRICQSERLYLSLDTRQQLNDLIDLLQRTRAQLELDFHADPARGFPPPNHDKPL